MSFPIISIASLEVVPADGLEGVENCIVVKGGTGDVPKMLDIAQAAGRNGAVVLDTDEAAADLIAIQFPGGSQQRLTQDEVQAKLQNLMKGKRGE